MYVQDKTTQVGEFPQITPVNFTTCYHIEEGVVGDYVYNAIILETTKGFSMTRATLYKGKEQVENATAIEYLRSALSKRPQVTTNV
jgi:hypothetical protein